jgi:hypothetical protein
LLTQNDARADMSRAKHATYSRVFTKGVIEMTSFSLRETAAIAEIRVNTIRIAIEKRSMEPPSSRVGKPIRYEFDLNELLFITFLRDFPLSQRG